MGNETLRLNAILDTLKRRKAEFEKNYGITAIGVFGSYARGDTRSGSDVDIVVKMKKPELFFMVHIKETLEADLLRDVDLVRFRERMNPYLKSRIEKEVIYA